MWKNPIRTIRRRAGLTQAALASKGGTSQPTIAAYEAEDRIPNLRTAQRLAEAAGLEMTLEFGPPLTREDLRSLALHEVIAGKLRDAPGRAIAQARQTLARMQEANPNASPLLDLWTVILQIPVEHIVDVMLDPRPFARELRHCTPFAGLLTPDERTRAYLSFADSERERIPATRKQNARTPE